MAKNVLVEKTRLPPEERIQSHHYNVSPWLLDWWHNDWGGDNNIVNMWQSDPPLTTDET